MFLVNNQGTKGITVLAQRRQKKKAIERLMLVNPLPTL